MKHNPPKAKSRLSQKDIPAPLYLGLIALIGAIGLILRVISLDTIPPGLHFDQAANGLLGLEILSGRAQPVFFSSYAGREALFMYLIAGLSALLGPGIVALRLAGAVCGAATVVAVGYLGATLYNRRVGVLAAAFLAGLYWHLHVSRLGERTIMVPLLDTLALLAIWNAFRSRSVALALLGGALAGLQLYTYPSSRFFLVMLVGFGLLERGIALLGNPESRIQHPELDQGDEAALADSLSSAVTSPRPRSGLWILDSGFFLAAAILIAAILTAAPLALHFAHVPADFLGRADEVAIWNAGAAGPSPLRAFLTSAERTLAMFVLRGDADWKYNLAFRPVFEPVSAALFLLGLGATLWGWWRRANRLCLLWWICLLVPGFLSVDAPQFMRTLGAAPPAVLFAARGLDLVVRAARQAKLTPIRRGAPALYVWPLVAGALATYQYFTVWAPSPAAYLALEGDVTAAAQIIRTQSPRYAATYVASRYGADPTESFLDGDLFSRLRWFDGRSALPLPPPGSAPTLYVLPRTATDSSWYERLPSTDRVAEVIAPDHGAAVEAFVLRPDSLPPLASAASPNVDFAGVARLVGADVPGAVQAGLPVSATLYWRIEKPPAADVKFFAHLVDAAGQTWAQYDEDVYPAAEWRAGQLVLVHRPLPVPDDVPIGSYTLQVGIERANGEGLAATNLDDHSVGTSWQSPPFAVIRPERPPSLNTLGIERPTNVVVGGAVRLVGASVAPTTALDGDSVAVTLFWQTVRPPPGDLETVVQATDQAGRIVARSIQAPTGGVWPAHDWRPGDVVVDRQRLLIPAGTPAGPVTLTVGLRDRSGQDATPEGAPATRVPIGTLTIKARPRSAVAPTIAHPMTVPFQEGVRLVGYDLDATTVHPGQTIHLTLYWQTERAVFQSWTVFTHLLDPAEKIRAQNDSVPAGGRRPTTTWAPGETIADQHILVVQADAPAGADRLEFGLYDAATGRRLQTAGGDDRVLLDVPVEIIQAVTIGLDRSLRRVEADVRHQRGEVVNSRRLFSNAFSG